MKTPTKLSVAGRTADTSETSLEPAAREELLDRFRHDATQRPRPGLKALLVGRDIAVEVLLEHLIKNLGLWMPRTVNGRRFASQNARTRRGAIAVLDSNFLQKISAPAGSECGTPPPAAQGKRRHNRGVYSDSHASGERGSLFRGNRLSLRGAALEASHRAIAGLPPFKSYRPQAVAARRCCSDRR